MNKRSALSRVCSTFLSVLVFSTFLLAQGSNGAFSGTVTDPSGAAVAGATVTITNVDTGLTVTATTNQTGSYTSQSVPAGVYKLSVEAPNFKRTATNNIKLDVGTTQRADVKLQLGARTETVEVTAEAPQINTEDSKLSANIGATQIANLPLNGRNVYDLIQYAPGASSVKGVLSENGAGAVVNGVRENFNGFLMNGVTNKGLSGGYNSQPIQDTVQEFQLLTLNMSAQYGSSAGSITNLVTKSGTNALHGSLFEFLRNDYFDANNFFTNQVGAAKPKLRFNQFGATAGGPIIKDKLFFYGAYQGDRFITTSLPATVTEETPGFRSAVISAFPNSVAALLYKNFPPSISGPTSQTLTSYIATGNSGFDPNSQGFNDFTDYLCDANSSLQIAQRFATLFGVTAAESTTLAGMGCTALPAQAGAFSRTAPFLQNSINIAKSRSQGNLRHGNEFSGRIDWNPSQNDRVFIQVNRERSSDEFSGGTTGVRGFTNPTHFIATNGQFNFVHTFTPAVVNEFRAGYTGTNGIVNASLPGVPSIGMDDGTLGFGSYNGYPQFFKENVYNYGDMVSITKGKHSFKAGVDIKRNIENSEFNVGRPSYYFFDPLFFVADAPYGMAAGVDPAIANGASGSAAHLQSNVRHWRNWEYGAYFQDDWKVSHNFTLNLGLRYDLYQRHTELNNLATTFLPGPGNGVIDNITTGAGQIKDANTPFTVCTAPNAKQRSVLAGVCGPGGFAPASSLGKGNHKNFGPRVGFAWDVFGNGKSALRAGYGLSYEGTLYNPLSNSRWNPPYYSFNQTNNFLQGEAGSVIYGPQSGGAPSFTGPADPLNHQGSGDTAVGNIMGWDPANQNQAVLTGIIFPQGIRDPYVHNWFLGIQQQLAPKLSVEVNYVGTGGHKLFRAENVNRVPGSTLPKGVCDTDIFGRQLCSQKSANNPSGRRLNPNYGRLRVWENVVNSSYNALQISVKKASSYGLTLNGNYTLSHSIDGGSTWHSGATSANGRAGGEGFSTDQTRPGLDRGNSIFDIRHKFGLGYVYELPWFKNSSGPVNWILGGWQLNGIVSHQSGAHWSPFCALGSTCDLNKDGERNDRPNSDVSNFTPSHDQQANGWGSGWCYNPTGVGISVPGGCTTPHFGGNGSSKASPGNLGRNSFVGPSFTSWDPSLFKNFKFTERVGMQFRYEVFNALNKVNFQLPGANGAGHNNVKDTKFGQAGGTFNPRQMQFGLKLTF